LPGINPANHFMTLFALILVLASAVLHATWNLFAKRVGGGIPFVWLFSTIATVIYAPVLLITILQQTPQFGPTHALFLFGTIVLHVAYYLLLNRGYQVADLSLVYPLARGSGPLLATVSAVALLGERPTIVAIGGTILIAIGVFALTGDPRKLRSAGNLPGVAYGLATGVTIAGYTIWDKQAVSVIMITPLMLLWFSGLGRTILLAPIAIRRIGEVRAAWSAHRGEVLGISVLDTLSYLLFLTALAFSPVSYVAPARQMSILIGALMGQRLLAEEQASRRLVSVGAMMVGLVILALG
jgi:drug/metabolite transporter (DMT)-like permease